LSSKSKEMKKATLLSIALLLVIAAAKAQCTAGFTWAQTGANTISFTNTSSGASSPTYYWHFGDGNTD
jgi:PKD repeat protein